MSAEVHPPAASAAFPQILIAAASAVFCAYAAAASTRFATPIDDALPLIAVILSVVAAISSPAVLVSVPLVLGGEIAITDERTRLLWFGLVVGLSFAAALMVSPVRFWRSATLAVGSIVLLRWIPLSGVRWPREVLLLFFAVAIVAALRSTALAVPVAVATALFTPLIPLRSLWLPLVVLVISAAIAVWTRTSARAAEGGPKSATAPVAAFFLAAVLTFFAWSGVVARALPIVLRGLPLPSTRATIAMALVPGQSEEFDVPPDARALIVSGANVSRLRRGTVIGRIEPGGIVLRMGTVADWGSLRREHFYSSRNRLPSRPAGLLRGYGYGAWIDGAARIALPKVRTIRVSAERELPPDARLQVESFELEPR